MIIRKFSTNSNILITALLLLFFLFSLPNAFAQEHEPEEHPAIPELEHATTEPDGFNAGETIMGHVMDDHSWHILDYKDSEGHEHALAIPLPIIIYDKVNKSWHFFLSSKFEHGHAAYDGFKLFSQTKIVRADDESEDGVTAAELYDFSITKTTFAVFISALLMLWIFLSIAKAYKKREGQAPKGLQSFMEPIILFIRDDVAKPSIGKDYERYMPYLLTLFFFILISNLMGLIPVFPGGSNINGNIAVTMVMAIFTFIITTASTNKAYWVHIVNMPGVPWWLKFPVPLMPIVELMGVFTKPFVLMVRLFANILAGHIVLLGFISMIFIFGAMSPAAGYGVSIVSVGFSVFLSLLEILVAFIQAYVFTLLSALYFGMAKVTDH
jgi:F-type H+-transporting ATPase subunit a